MRIIYNYLVLTIDEVDLIHIAHGFQGDIPEYQLMASGGDITGKGFRVNKGLIFWYSRPRRHVIYVM